MSDTAPSLVARLDAVRERVRSAAERAGRAGGVLLVAVSKGQPAEALRAAYAAGQRDFGENYVQELATKAAALADLDGVRFHFVGHLQKNKAKHAARLVSSVASLDSSELARELDRRAGPVPVARRVFGDDPRLPVLVEVNVAGESQKSGCSPSELGALLEAADACEKLRVVGLMCVPPFSDDPEQALPHFRALARLRDEHGGPERLPELSMGMTADYEQAISAGATVVRVGTAIFGPRAART